MATRRRGGESTSEVLQRIQLETERVKRRLNSSCDSVSADSSIDNGDNIFLGNRGEQTNPNRSAADSFSDKYVQNYQQQQKGRGYQQGVVDIERSREAAPEFIIEPSSGNIFEDPVPSSQMSNHLKSEHEAFKAK